MGVGWGKLCGSHITGDAGLARSSAAEEAAGGKKALRGPQMEGRSPTGRVDNDFLPGAAASASMPSTPPHHETGKYHQSTGKTDA